MASRVRPDEGVLQGALVCVMGLLFLLLAGATAAECRLGDQEPRGLQEVGVERVLGFDRLRLTDGRTIRLIGLTPAVPLPEAMAPVRDLSLHEGVRDALEARLEEAGQHLTLRAGHPARDSRDRPRMHAWLPDGALLAARLIAAGAAMPRPGPRPDPLDACLYAAEAEARAGERGLWLERPEALPVRVLDPLDGALRQGRLRVQGDVVAVREPGRHWVMELYGPLDLLIRGDDRDHWPDLEPESLTGEAVIVRGRVYPWRDRLRMRIRHPLDLEVED
ncbi:nuclease [Thioalkalivibrio sp.]|uniref:nuclease n=1 Tax=Thioalkalivibrio sp. TaxID=2093813 RepID=UPI003565A609